MRSTRILQLIVGLPILLLSGKLYAQALPETVTKKIDSLFVRWNLPNSPGCAIGIVRNDSLIYTKGYGMANLEYDIAISPETIFHMASVSKQFTAFSIVLLAEQGKLKLDDDIRKYLPWFPNLKTTITIRQLLNHTSGIRDQWQLLAIAGTRLDDVITQDQIIKVLSKQQALNFNPCEQYSYSNSGFTMLAEIVKSVTGKTIRQFTDSAIFKPLGMGSTHFHDNYTEIVKNRAYSYYSYQRGYPVRFSNSILSYSNAGATSLFTNVNDMAKWIMNFYLHKVGTDKTIQQLTEKGTLKDGSEQNYALGISVGEYRGQTEYSHSGADAGFRTYVSIFPELKMGFVIFSNLGDFFAGSNKTYEMANIFIKDVAEIPKKPAAIDTSDAIAKGTNFPGNYIAEDGVQFNFPLRNQRLYWERGGRNDLLIPAEKDSFLVTQSPEVKFIFSTTATDTIVKEYWPDNMRTLIKYTKDSVQTDPQLQVYTGTYYCPELDCKYDIALNDHHLVLTNTKYNDSKLTLTGYDDLFCDSWWMSHLKITRGRKNKITGFQVSNGRIMHLQFNKLN